MHESRAVVREGPRQGPAAPLTSQCPLGGLAWAVEEQVLGSSLKRTRLVHHGINAGCLERGPGVTRVRLLDTPQGVTARCSR